MKLTDKIARWGSDLSASIKSLVKTALQARPCAPPQRDIENRTIIILANGPSLAETIRDCADSLKEYPLMAVNFAAIAPEFSTLRPQYYILADPFFFHGDDTGNISRLRKALAAVDWPMTLIVPAREKKLAARYIGENPNITTATFNFFAFEGFKALRHTAYRCGLGMPRPRNVLIPAIMEAIAAGFDEIYIVGADHSWMQTISVNNRNEVVTVQPHFYQEHKDEKERITSDYVNIPLHKVVESFAVAFRAYHLIADYAGSRGVRIYNSTPRSFIDAFPRRPLPTAE